MNEMKKIVESSNSFSFQLYNVSTYLYETDNKPSNYTFVLNKSNPAKDVFQNVNGTEVKYSMTGFSKPFTWETYCKYVLPYNESDNRYILNEGDSLNIVLFSNKEYIGDVVSLVGQLSLYVIINNKQVDLSYKDNLNTSTKNALYLSLTNEDISSLNQLSFQVFGVKFNDCDWECKVTYKRRSDFNGE